MTARLHYWYLTHPRCGRPALLLAALHGMAIVALCAAPQASASTNAVVLNWTGLRDSYGVAIGDYYLAMASLRDQISEAGPGVSWNPETWMQWSTHALETALASVTLANILTAEAGLFVGIVALAMWVMKITVSTYWLTVIGEITRAIDGQLAEHVRGTYDRQHCLAAVGCTAGDLDHARQNDVQPVAGFAFGEDEVTAGEVDSLQSSGQGPSGAGFDAAQDRRPA